MNKKDKPFVNYVLGYYGHVPYKREYKKRPNAIDVRLKAESNQVLKDITNQFYYRTGAVAEYLKQLYRIDPSSVILIISDHLPCILNSKINYDFSKYTNISLLVSNRKFIDVSGFKYYQISYKIWELLGGNKTENKSKEQMKKLYYSLHKESQKKID